jgi:hypothetical protein
MLRHAGNPRVATRFGYKEDFMTHVRETFGASGNVYAIRTANYADGERPRGG